MDMDKRRLVYSKQQERQTGSSVVTLTDPETGQEKEYIYTEEVFASSDPSFPDGKIIWEGSIKDFAAGFHSSYRKATKGTDGFQRIEDLGPFSDRTIY